MLGACPQIMAVLGSLTLYALGKYLRVRGPWRDLREHILSKFLSKLMDYLPPPSPHSQLRTTPTGEQRGSHRNTRA